MDFIFTILPFIIGVSIFVFYIYIRSILKRNHESLKEHFSILRKMQNDIRELNIKSEMYNESDPDPYGKLAKSIKENLSLCAQYLLELNNWYSNNINLYRRIAHPEVRDLLYWLVNLRENDQGLLSFMGTYDILTKLSQNIVNDFTKLANISNEVIDKSKNLIDLINKNKYTLHQLEELNLSDDNFLRESSALDQWEQTVLHQIPVFFIAASKGVETEQPNKPLVAKVWRLVNKIEPEIVLIDSRISSWETDYQTIQSLKESIKINDEKIIQCIQNLSTDPILAVDCDGITRDFDTEAKFFFGITQKTPTVKELSTHVTLLKKTESTYIETLKKLSKTSQYHSELKEKIKKRQIFHNLEWLNNSLHIMEEAREFNSSNWPADIRVDVLYTKLNLLLNQQTGIIPEITTKSISAENLDVLSEIIKTNEVEFENVNSIFKKYFHVLREILRIEEDIQTDLKQYYSALRQLMDITLSNPAMLKQFKSRLEKFQGNLENFNQLMSDRTSGKLEIKLKKWKALSLKINKTVYDIGKEIEQENFILSTAVNNQIRLIQGYLALNEPVYLNALTAIRDGNVDKGNSIFLDLNMSVLVSVQHIKNLSQIWHQLTSSKAALGEITNPVTVQLEKLDKARTSMLKTMQIADIKLPAGLSWPPTTKVLTSERAEFVKIEDKYKLLKNNKGTAIQLITRLNELTDNYKELSVNIKSVMAEAEVESSKFNDLEKRFYQSINLWQELSNSHNGNFTLQDNIHNFIESVDKDYQELKSRYLGGRLPYSQAFQMMRLICRKIDQESIEYDNRRVINISGEVHQRL